MTKTKQTDIDETAAGLLGEYLETKSPASRKVYRSEIKRFVRFMDGGLFVSRYSPRSSAAVSSMSGCLFI